MVLVQSLVYHASRWELNRGREGERSRRAPKAKIMSLGPANDKTLANLYYIYM
jgi:hypothetical protein